jgi:molecular chaperone GrpE (heat shock protein)
MQNEPEPRLSKLPFFIADLFLLGAAYYISAYSKLPLSIGHSALLVLCVGAGALIAVLPFVLEYRLKARLAEGKQLATAVAQIENLEKVGSQITEATGLWQNAHGEAEKVKTAAQSIAERMNAEVQAFTEFMQKVNDNEKATLRLEVEKLRRAESDWLQVLVRMMDHVYALHLGATRSGQPKLIEQLAHFQNACRDAARRVGLTPFSADPAEPFNAERHQVLEGNGEPVSGASVAETLATGYTFQGRLLRPALVRLQDNGQSSTASTGAVESSRADAQGDLPVASSSKSG